MSSGFKLYEINQLLLDAIAASNEKVNEETGEIPEDWSKFLDDVQMERDIKCLHVARYIKSLNAEADAIWEERKKLEIRANALYNRAGSLKIYLAGTIVPGEELKDSTSRISWRASTKVSIMDESVIPEHFWKIKKDPMTKEIGEELKAGREVPGCVLSKNNNIQIK